MSQPHELLTYQHVGVKFGFGWDKVNVAFEPMSPRHVPIPTIGDLIKAMPLQGTFYLPFLFEGIACMFPACPVYLYLSILVIC